MTMLGHVTPRWAFACSRYARQARIMLSVPPDVPMPQHSASPWNRLIVMRRISASICPTDLRWRAPA
jgi:hypothetical protein